MKEADLLIRCDYFPGSGVGHLKRCSVLAKTLRSMGTESALVVDVPCGELPVEISVPVVSSEYDAFDEVEDALRLIALARQHSACLVIGDSYRISSRWIEVLKEAGLKVLVIDDLGIGGSADVRVDYSPSARACPGPAISLLGPQFFISDSPKLASRSGTYERVVAHAGGNADFSSSPAVYSRVAALADQEKIELSWLCPEEKIEELERTGWLSDHHHVLDWQKGRTDLWRRFDLVVGPASTSLFEGILQGVLPVSFPISPTQLSDRARLLSLGHALHLSAEEAASPALVESILELALSHGPYFRSALDRFACLLDTDGAARVAEFVVALLKDALPPNHPRSESTEPGSVRACDLRDAAGFLDARNSEEVRQCSTDPDYIITWPEHLAWWLRDEVERFVLEGPEGPEAYFWHVARSVGSRHYLVGGWFPSGKCPPLSPAIRVLDWQLEYCAARYPNHQWIATIRASNRAVLSLNLRYGFIEAGKQVRRDARLLFPGTSNEFVILQRKART